MLRIGRDIKDQSFQFPCHGQGHLPLPQMAQRLIQSGLELFFG